MNIFPIKPRPDNPASNSMKTEDKNVLVYNLKKAKYFFSRLCVSNKLEILFRLFLYSISILDFRIDST
jgi:hypothetical protein